MGMESRLSIRFLQFLTELIRLGRARLPPLLPRLLAASLRCFELFLLRFCGWCDPPINILCQRSGRRAGPRLSFLVDRLRDETRHLQVTSVEEMAVHVDGQWII